MALSCHVKSDMQFWLQRWPEAVAVCDTEHRNDNYGRLGHFMSDDNVCQLSWCATCIVTTCYLNVGEKTW